MPSCCLGDWNSWVFSQRICVQSSAYWTYSNQTTVNMPWMFVESSAYQLIKWLICLPACLPARLPHWSTAQACLSIFQLIVLLFDWLRSHTVCVIWMNSTSFKCMLFRSTAAISRRSDWDWVSQAIHCSGKSTLLSLSHTHCFIIWHVGVRSHKRSCVYIQYVSVFLWKN